MRPFAQENPDEYDCSEGCTDECNHPWEIEPATLRDFDIDVADSPEEALRKLLEVAVMTWDSIQPGEECTITIRRKR